MDLISLLVFVVIVGVLFWAFRKLAETFEVPSQVVTVVYVLLVVLVVLYVLQALGLYSGVPSLRIR